MSSICLVAENRTIQGKRRMIWKGSEYCKAWIVFVVQISKHSGTGYVLSIAEARVHNRISPCRICGGQSDTATGFSPSTLVLPCQYHSAKAPHLVKYRRSYIILATDSVLRQYALLFLTHTHTHSLSFSTASSIVPPSSGYSSYLLPWELQTTLAVCPSLYWTAKHVQLYRLHNKQNNYRSCLQEQKSRLYEQIMPLGADHVTKSRLSPGADHVSECRSCL